MELTNSHEAANTQDHNRHITICGNDDVVDFTDVIPFRFRVCDHRLCRIKPDFDIVEAHANQIGGKEVSGLIGYCAYFVHFERASPNAAPVGVISTALDTKKFLPQTSLSYC